MRPGGFTTAEKALRLLLTQDEAEATELAPLLLDAQNRERQTVEKEFLSRLTPKSQRNLIPLYTRPSSLGHATGIPASLELSHRALRANIIVRQSLSVLMGTIWERAADVASKVFR